jgi:hypothetical protein
MPAKSCGVATRNSLPPAAAGVLLHRDAEQAYSDLVRDHGGDFDAMRNDRRPIGIVPNRGILPEALIHKLKPGLSGLCLVIAVLLPLSATAQITEPLPPLLPTPAPLSTPTAPEASRVEPQSGYPGETVTSRYRSEFNPLGLRFGDYYWFPRAELDESYNGNIFAATTAPSADLITTLAPSFDLLSIFPRSALNLHGSAFLQNYATHSTQNTQSGTIGTDGSLDVTDTSSIFGNAQISHPYISYGSPNSPTGIAEPVTYWNYTSRVGYQQGGRRITYGLDAGVDAAQYNAAPLLGGGVSPQSSQNSIVPDAAVHVGYEITPDYIGYVRFGGSWYNYLRAPSTNFTSYHADVGLQILPRHLIYGNVYAGYLLQNFSHPTTTSGSTSFPDYGGELVWNVTTLTTLTFDGLRTFYTGTPASSITLVPGPAGNGYLVSTVGARVDHELLRNLLLSLNGTFENDSFQGITRTDNVFTVGAGFTYLINRFLFLGGNYSYYKRISTASGSSFNQNVLTLRLGTQF